MVVILIDDIIGILYIYAEEMCLLRALMLDELCHGIHLYLTCMEM